MCVVYLTKNRRDHWYRCLWFHSSLSLEHCHRWGFKGTIVHLVLWYWLSSLNNRFTVSTFVPIPYLLLLIFVFIFRLGLDLQLVLLVSILLSSLLHKFKSKKFFVDLFFYTHCSTVGVTGPTLYLPELSSQFLDMLFVMSVKVTFIRNLGCNFVTWSPSSSFIYVCRPYLSKISSLKYPKIPRLRDHQCPPENFNFDSSKNFFLFLDTNR